MEQNNKALRLDAMVAIREATGFTPQEKAALFVIYSRGEVHFGQVSTLASNIGLGTKQARRILKSLRDKGAINLEERTGNTHKITLNVSNLQKMVPLLEDTPPLQGTPPSQGTPPPHVQGDSPTREGGTPLQGRGDSPTREGKENLKENIKENKEGKQDGAPAVAVSQTSSNFQVRKNSNKDKTDDLPSNSLNTPPAPKKTQKQLGEGAVFSGVSEEECKEEAMRVGVYNSYLSYRDAKFSPSVSLMRAKKFARLSA